MIPFDNPGQQSLDKLTAGHPLAVKALRELRRDARRYRWLRLAGRHGPRTMEMRYHHVEHLDAAIDAAMKAAK